MNAFAIALALALPAVAQAASLPVRVGDGAAWTQTTVHTRTDEKAGSPAVSMTATTVIRERLHRTANAPATLEQTFVSFSVDGVASEQMAALAAQARAVYPATIEVDDSLTPIRVRNWPQMQATIFQAMGAATTDPKVMEGVKATFGAMTDSQASSLFKEQGLVALGQGTGLDVGKSRAYEGRVANVMGGPPIRTTGAFKLESYGGPAGHAVVLWTQSLDPQSTAESIKATINLLLQRMAPEKVAEAKVQLATLTIDRQDSCRYDIDVASGLAVKADCTVTLRTGSGSQTQSRTERWVITQSAPEKP